LHHFTVGQRRGLGLGGTARAWVRSLRAEDAAVVVCFQEAALGTSSLVAGGVQWTRGVSPAAAFEARVQVRSRHVAESARIEVLASDAVRVSFARPVRAVTPGQAAVLYLGDEVLGRGWIQAVEAQVA
jgi:tRNA-specific 2-thiouridylase